MAVVKNINNVVEDKIANPGNIRETRVFLSRKNGQNNSSVFDLKILENKKTMI